MNARGFRGLASTAAAMPYEIQTTSAQFLWGVDFAVALTPIYAPAPDEIVVATGFYFVNEDTAGAPVTLQIGVDSTAPLFLWEFTLQGGEDRAIVIPAPYLTVSPTMFGAGVTDCYAQIIVPAPTALVNGCAFGYYVPSP